MSVCASGSRSELFFFYSACLSADLLLAFNLIVLSALHLAMQTLSGILAPFQYLREILKDDHLPKVLGFIKAFSQEDRDKLAKVCVCVCVCVCVRVCVCVFMCV